jgi:hypothetical protein
MEVQYCDDGKYNKITAEVQHDNGGKSNIVTVEPKGHRIIKLPFFY